MFRIADVGANARQAYLSTVLTDCDHKDGSTQQCRRFSRKHWQADGRTADIVWLEAACTAGAPPCRGSTVAGSQCDKAAAEMQVSSVTATKTYHQTTS